MKKFLGLNHLDKAVKSLLLKMSEDGDCKVDKSSVSAELDEGVKIAEIAGISIYAPEGVSEEVFNQIRSEIGKAAGSVEAKDHITFSSSAPFTVSISPQWSGTVEYSTDLVVWKEIDRSINNELNSSVTSPSYLYFRGSGNTIITQNTSWNLNGSNISCSGNIETLLDYQTVLNGQHPVMGQYCFSHMFYQQSSLISAPELPATTLASSCYRNMFYNCTSLTTAPILPATTLVDYCYSRMFYGCTSLVTLPILPATTLTSECYYEMFRGCTSIKLSSTKTGDYQTPYRIPTSGTGTTASFALNSTFTGTGGSWSGSPTINTTYYLHSSNKVVPESTGGTSTPDWNDIENKPSFATVATSGSYNDLNNKPTIPAAQVNSDWNSTSGVSQILNKPMIPAEGTVVQILTSGIPIATIDGVTIYAPDPNA